VIKSINEKGRPIWDRPNLFPAVPVYGWGYYNRKNGCQQVAGITELKEAIRKDSADEITLVWTPSSMFLEVPEAIPELYEELKTSRTIGAETAMSHKSGFMKMGLFILSGYLFFNLWGIFSRLNPSYSSLERIVVSGEILYKKGTMIIGLLLWIMFAGMPWYELRKRWQEVKRWTLETMKDAADLAKFEEWMSSQKAKATKILLGLISVVGIFQIFHKDTRMSAALIKGADAERWRLLTAPMLHGNEVHFAMNALALLYLGKRMESLARWPHVPLVFFVSAWCGGELTMPFGHGQAVGASGGIMGMLGFLLVFETLHSNLVPRSSRRRLTAVLGGTALIGILGMQFIDNLAHLGGLLAGIVYALIVFPKSESAMRPEVNITDKITGSIGFLIIACCAFFACQVMMKGSV
jgi:membrane associated rhomboid family serine protease